MPKQPSTKELKTCRIEKSYIEYCTMQGINFNGLVNELLEAFLYAHQRSHYFRQYYSDEGISVVLKDQCAP